MHEPVEYTTNNAPPAEPADKEPYRPFTTRLDFEFSELMLDARMNEGQRRTLINLVNQVKEKPSSFTFQSVSQLDKTWEYARTFRGLEVCLTVIFSHSLILICPIISTCSLSASQ